MTIAVNSRDYLRQATFELTNHFCVAAPAEVFAKAREGENIDSGTRRDWVRKTHKPYYTPNKTGAYSLAMIVENQDDFVHKGLPVLLQRDMNKTISILEPEQVFEMPEKSPMADTTAQLLEPVCRDALYFPLAAAILWDVVGEIRTENQMAALFKAAGINTGPVHWCLGCLNPLTFRGLPKANRVKPSRMPDRLTTCMLYSFSAMGNRVVGLRAGVTKQALGLMDVARLVGWAHRLFERMVEQGAAMRRWLHVSAPRLDSSAHRAWPDNIRDWGDRTIVRPHLPLWIEGDYPPIYNTTDQDQVMRCIGKQYTKAGGPKNLVTALLEDMHTWP